MPVGPPWMSTSSGYCRSGSNPAGLCSTPSIVVPSVLVHETTSLVPTSQSAIWSVARVSATGSQRSTVVR